MLGKYSPTVSTAYSVDQKWFSKVAGKNSDRDPEGYDSYGYDENDVDRAGIHEHEYANNEELYDNVAYCYGFNGYLPFQERPFYRSIQMTLTDEEYNAVTEFLQNFRASKVK